MTSGRCLELIRSDAARRSCGLVRWVCWSGPAARFLVLLRVGRFATAKPSRLPLRALCRLLKRHYTHRYGLDVPYSTTIGPGLRFGNHMCSGGLVVNANTVIGTNCTLANGVTLGTHRGRSPVLGDDVVVSTRAIVIGGIVIGDGARVGAGAVVTRDVAPGTTVAGAPARPITSRDGASTASAAVPGDP
jgi:serine O-acetyltransferase